MSAVEIAKVINELREEGKAELRHDTFLQKIVKVLGVEVAQNFLGKYKASNGKQHKNVMADIRKIFAEVEIEPAEFSARYKDATGRMLPCYHLPRRECDLVIAGYSAKYRLAIIDRWRELERGISGEPLSGIDSVYRKWGEILNKAYTKKEPTQPIVKKVETVANSPVSTMSLKDITDLLEVRHNDAMKVVEKMAETPEFGEIRKFRTSYKNNLADEGLDVLGMAKIIESHQHLNLARKLETCNNARTV